VKQFKDAIMRTQMQVVAYLPNWCLKVVKIGHKYCMREQDSFGNWHNFYMRETLSDAIKDAVSAAKFAKRFHNLTGDINVIVTGAA
jgi:hypothetical protein